tara:strand:+ start:1593 stop:1937 length:345 start_codon:yes stop_codon:yes gene_type:complete
VKERCGKQFSIKTGTVFEDSPLDLPQWLVAVWCVANDGVNANISSYELGKALDVRQKTAWKMFYRIRKTVDLRKFKSTGADDKFRKLCMKLVRKQGGKKDDAKKEKESEQQAKG